MLNEDVIYLIMPHAYGGINGVRQRLGYLSDLGVTALWLTPVMRSMSYHGYDITDYYDVDPRYGTLSDYKALVKEAHEHGIKVIMDMVFNHCGSEHPWFRMPPEKDWFNGHDNGLISKPSMLTNYRLTTMVDPYASDYDKRQTVEGWFVKTMPDLNLRNKNLQKYFLRCTLWWIKQTGIDGIRMDTFPYADREAMEKWMKAVHKRHPDFHIIGETWVTMPPFSAKMQEGELDSPMDFALFEAFNYAKHEETLEPWSGLNRIYNVLCYDYLYPQPSRVMAFLDNHDVSRFAGDGKPFSTKVSNISVIMQMLAILLTIPRIPQIYYGTEVMMTGTTEKTDRNVRRNFPKRCLKQSARTPVEEEMHSFLSQLLAWRKGNSRLITEGQMTQFLPFKGVYVYARTLKEKKSNGSCSRVVVIANGNNSPATFRPERYMEVLGDVKEARDILSSKRISLTKPLRLQPRQTMILAFPPVEGRKAS